MTKRDRNAYQRAWRERNAARCRAYMEENRERIRARTRAYREKNAEKLRAKRRKWYAENRDKLVMKQRRYNATRRRSVCHGLTPNEILARLAEQGGKCASCSTAHPGSIRGWHGDHNHDTGRFRAVLCSGCNSALGLLKDDPIRLRAAADYIERHNHLDALL